MNALTYVYCKGLFVTEMTSSVFKATALRRISTTSVRWYDRKPAEKYSGWWRLKEGHAINKTKYGPLTDLPDFTFLDGRPTPRTPAQQRRYEERKEMGREIMRLLKEVDDMKEPNLITSQKKK